MENEIEEKGMNEFVRFILSDVAGIPKMIESEALKRADTAIMNPPFGAQEKGNDRPFLEAMIAAGNIVYFIHNKGSCAFIEKYIKPAVVTDCFITDFPIRKTYGFHKKEIQSIEVEIYRIDPCRKE
jgi:Predicted RNA methylase